MVDCTMMLTLNSLVMDRRRTCVCAASLLLLLLLFNSEGLYLDGCYVVCIQRRFLPNRRIAN